MLACGHTFMNNHGWFLLKLLRFTGMGYNYPATMAARETRSVTITDRDDLPNGECGFIEFYCDEPHCDCRRVMVVVLRPETGWKFWAAINYGWESVEFCRRWAGTPPSDDSPWQGPVLDPLTEQTAHAPADCATRA